ncbi:MAG: heavy metal-binding domain-containing protein [Kordiimonadaceae bacterium]|nr:heavy metal-binding domain-containing protein [Kordiimonadaceae bacterium]MBT6328614.1 heavy metal-binding domain-containing protein [Kordiimonadaceae bacterium]
MNGRRKYELHKAAPNDQYPRHLRPELAGYTELLEDARKEATERMITDARNIGANAIVNVRFSTTSVTQGAAELFAYGTAVYVESE